MPEYDPLKVRPRDGWVIVLSDARKKELESGLLLAPNETGAEKVCEGAGVVVRVGGGDKNKTLGLEPGLRVMYRSYLRWANPIVTEQKWPDGQVKQYFIINSDDIMGAVPDGVQVGVYSGRPQVPVKK